MTDEPTEPCVCRSCVTSREEDSLTDLERGTLPFTTLVGEAGPEFTLPRPGRLVFWRGRRRV